MRICEQGKKIKGEWEQIKVEFAKFAGSKFGCMAQIALFLSIHI